MILVPKDTTKLARWLAALRPLFPDAVAIAVAAEGEDPGASFAEEDAAVRTAVPKRRQEFLLGRRVARAALRELGVEPAPIPVGASRAPRWPAGVVGSITHCPDFVGAAVARTTALSAVGFDAEVAAPLPAELLRYVCRAGELERSGVLSPLSPADHAALIFSAKEAVYKCVSHSSPIVLDFLDVTIVHAPDGTFAATLHRDDYDGVRDFGAIRGRYGVGEGFVFSSAVIDAS